jgi:hypothetical protein
VDPRYASGDGSKKDSVSCISEWQMMIERVCTVKQRHFERILVLYCTVAVLYCGCIVAVVWLYCTVLWPTHHTTPQTVTKRS